MDRVFTALGDPSRRHLLDVLTCLRITHGDLEPDSEMFPSVSYGGRALMSGMKTMLKVRPPA